VTRTSSRVAALTQSAPSGPASNTKPDPKKSSVDSRAFADQKPLSVGPFDDLNSATFQLIRYDRVNQLVDYRHVLLGPAGITVLPSTHRVIYLSELDLMARLAGLTLVTRQGDWTGGRFDASSGRHISVYEKR
jgi:hypothetical protein